MALFEYKGVNKSGKSTRGSIEADSLRTAQTRLKRDGIFVIEIKNKKKAKKARSSRAKKRKISTEELSLMTRQLSTLLKANVPLVDTLSAVSEQVENPDLGEALSEIRGMVNEGSSFHKAIAKYPHYFDVVFVSMCEAGEVSGTLDVILLRLAEFSQAQDELMKQVKSAVLYPIVMLVMTTGMMVMLFTYVIPTISEIFEQRDVPLPWYSQIVIDASGFLLTYWHILGMGALGSYVLFRSWKSTPNGLAQWDRIRLKLPLLGHLTRLIAVSRFTRTLGTLLNGGVPMLQSLDISKNVVNNTLLVATIEEARDNISEGESIAGPLKKSGQFPPIVTHMINIGEKTGDLESMLTQVSDAYDFQVKTQVQGMVSLLAPLLVVFMGLAIGIIAVAIMVPLFQMSNIAG